MYRAAILVAAALVSSAQTPTPAPQSQPPQAPVPQAPAPQAPAPRAALGVVVIDAAHGGTDSGARGESGVVEKEVVITLAQALRREFERQGLRVVMTRSSDTPTTFDDRAAIANAVPGAVFLTLHVASSGQAGTATTYSLTPPLAEPAASGPNEQPASAVPSFLVPWQDAQLRFIADSRRLAELLQIQLAQKFKGSPETPERGAIRQLRLVGHPAVAVEISSVAVEQPMRLQSMAPGLAEAFLRALEAFRQPAEAGRP